MPSSLSLKQSPARAVVAAIALFAAAGVGAQEHTDVTSTGNGARAAGLGYAVTAVADDIFSIGWNPAGLARLQRGEFALIGRLMVMGTGASSVDVSSPGLPSYGANGEISGGFDVLEFAGIAIPFTAFNRRIVPAVAYRRFVDGKRPGVFETAIRQTNGRYFGSTKYSTVGGVMAISPSLAVEVTDRIRVGATANLLSGSKTYTIRGPFPYEYDSRELDYEGMAIEAGALVTVRDDLDVGVHVTLPHARSFRFDNDTTIRAVTRAAPLAIAVGAALTLSPKTRLSADLRHAAWSGATYRLDSDSSDVRSQIGVNDGSSLHFGFERDVTNEIRRSKVRLGAYLRRTTLIDLDEKPISNFGVTAGQSWYLRLVTVDLAMQYQRSSKWKRMETSTQDVTVWNHDLVMSIGLRRHF